MYKENISNKFKKNTCFKENVVEILLNAYHYFHPYCLFSIKIFCKECYIFSINKFFSIFQIFF